MFGGGDFKPKSAFVHVTIMGDQNKGDRMTIDFNVPCDVEALRENRDEQGKFIAESIHKFEKELKYSAPWTCFACGEPAHEVVHNPMSWLHAQPAFVMDYVHMVCRRSKPSCRKLVEQSIAELSEEMGVGSTAPPQPVSTPSAEAGGALAQGAENEEDKGEPSSENAAGGCAVCGKEDKTLQCSRCKTIRYCSADCQKADYPRHKVICKWVDNVEKSFAADKKEKEEKPGGDDWPAGIPRPFDGTAPAHEHDHSNC